MPALPLDHLRPISLDELNSAAALMTRTDRKYVVPVAVLSDLLRTITASVLTIDGQRAMRYESTYFDTPQLDSFLGAAHGRRRRFKVRTRHYADSGERWLEVKTRGRRNLTVKHRIPYLAAIPGQLDDEHLDFIRGELALGGVVGIDPAQLRSELDTTYYRSTLLLSDGLTRVTIDQRLAWASARGDAQVGDVVIVETKTGSGTASEFDHSLWAAGQRPAKISKYGTGMRLLKRRLPGNRWHRVMTRQLAGLTPVTKAL